MNWLLSSQITLIGTSGISGSYVELRAWGKSADQNSGRTLTGWRETAYQNQVFRFRLFFLCSYHANNKEIVNRFALKISLCCCNKIAFLEFWFCFASQHMMDDVYVTLWVGLLEKQYVWIRVGLTFWCLCHVVDLSILFRSFVHFSLL